MKTDDEYWIQKAVKKEGSFSEYCKRKGYNGVTWKCIEEAKKSKFDVIRKRAVLAETLLKLQKKKR